MYAVMIDQEGPEMSNLRSGTREGRPLSGYRQLSLLLWTTMWVLLLAYAVGLSIHGYGFEPFTDLWLGSLTQLLPAAVCWAAVPRAGVRRTEVTLLALGISAFAAGNVIFVRAASHSSSLPFPSAGDVGYLSFYPLVLASLAVALRHALRGIHGSALLDSALSALGGACGVAALLGPVFEGVAGGRLAQLVALAYPLFDILLIGAAVGIAAINGWHRRSAWHWPVAGLTVFVAADVIYALRVVHSAYVVGTVLDVLWPLGLSLLAVWAHKPAGTGAYQQRTVLAVPAIAGVVSVAVLCVASRVHLPLLAIVLAALTLLSAGARRQLAFRQLHRLADLRRQATTDDLTGLPNRRALYAGVNSMLDGPAQPRALLLLDLDRFKEVNDSLGHHVGDQLLILAAHRLRDELREGDLLARLGGDEFAVLLADADEAQARAVAVKLRAALGTPFTLDSITLHTAVSIGIALSPEHGSDLGLLLRRADMAMYKAKHAREGFRVYSGTDDVHGQERMRTIQELRKALVEDQLLLHYQPKVDLQTGDIRGVEALVRWDHPTRGLLYPVHFLDLIEDCGLMHQMTKHVLERALDQAREWQVRGRPLGVAVNLSASSLLDAELPDYVAGQLASRGLAPGALQLEITEETLMSDRDQARLILSRLRDYGVEIAVDDFGTGYSSLAYLRELPIDELKLDRSFVFPMADDARAAALVASTISLAHSLGLRMVAEGVEDQVAYAELSRYGCDQVQGFYISRPMPAAELDHWLAQRLTLAGANTP